MKRPSLIPSVLLCDVMNDVLMLMNREMNDFEIIKFLDNTPWVKIRYS